MRVSINGGTPIAGWFIRDYPSKLDDDWGYPYDLGHPQKSQPPSTRKKNGHTHHGSRRSTPRFSVDAVRARMIFCLSFVGKTMPETWLIPPISTYKNGDYMWLPPIYDELGNGLWNCFTYSSWYFPWLCWRAIFMLIGGLLFIREIPI